MQALTYSWDGQSSSHTAVIDENIAKPLENLLQGSYARPVPDLTYYHCRIIYKTGKVGKLTFSALGLGDVWSGVDDNLKPFIQDLQILSKQEVYC